MKKRFSLILLTFLYFNFSSMAFAQDGKNLFVSLSSDDLDRAAMAVSISTKVLTTEDIPVTIFLSAQGVRWADKNIPQNTYANGQTVPQMLQEFMKSGGHVIICEMCMENVGGMTKEDVLDGIKFTGGVAGLLADDTITLSY